MSRNAATLPFAPNRPDHFPAATGTAKRTLDQLGNVGIVKVQAADPGSHLTGLAWLDTDAVQAITRSASTFTSNQTLSDSYDVVLVDCTAGSLTMTLPAASSSAGFLFDIKKIDGTANTVTVDADGTDEIDEGLTAVLTVQYESITIVCDGTDWWVL